MTKLTPTQIVILRNLGHQALSFRRLETRLVAKYTENLYDDIRSLLRSGVATVDTNYDYLLSDKGASVLAVLDALNHVVPRLLDDVIRRTGHTALQVHTALTLLLKLGNIEYSSRGYRLVL